MRVCGYIITHRIIVYILIVECSQSDQMIVLAKTNEIVNVNLLGSDEYLYGCAK